MYGDLKGIQFIGCRICLTPVGTLRGRGEHEPMHRRAPTAEEKKRYRKFVKEHLAKS